MLRPCAIYGPYDRAFLAYFRMIKSGWRVVLGDGSRRFQAAFGPDISAACVAAASRGPEGLHTYYLVPRDSVSWEEFGRTMELVVGRQARRLAIPDWLIQPGLLECLPPLAGEANRLRDLLPRRWEADPSRAQADLEWKATTPLAEGLKRTWEWYRQRGWIQ